MKKIYADGLGDLVPRPAVILRKKERKDKNEEREHEEKVEEIVAAQSVDVVKGSHAAD